MTNPTYRAAIHRAATVAAVCLLSSSAFAKFNILKDVNSGKPPKDIMVVFDKTKDPKSFKATDKNGNAEISFADDGALRIRIHTRGASEIILPFPEAIDITKANYVLLTCKLEGQSRGSWQGNWHPWKPYTGEKLYWLLFGVDTSGRRTNGVISFDACAPDGYLPTEMTTLKLPAKFLATPHPDFGDPTQLNALMILIGHKRDTDDRDQTLIIERIAIAE